MTAPTPRETADHAELARLAEAAISSGVGGRLPTTSIELSAFIAAANPARVLALLSEIAALRGQYELDGFTLQASVDRATQAERQRDEAVDLLKDMLTAFGGPMTRRALGGHDERQMAVTIATRAFLANQGAE